MGASALSLPARLLSASAMLAALSMFAASPAAAGCTATGTTTVVNCDSTNATVTMTAGTGSLTVTDLSTASVIYDSVQTPGTYNQTVNLTGTTTLNRPGYSALVMQFGTTPSNPPQVIAVAVNADVNIGANVTATSGPGGGFGTIWVRNDYAGNISINNAGTITLNVPAGTSGADAPNFRTSAIDGSTHLGGVTIINSGSVTSNNGRGLYADGNCGPVGPDGCLGAEVPQTVSITNTSTGTVTADMAGIRVIDYHGLATLTNNGTVTSTLFQGLIAWAQTGDATVTNTGTVTSNVDNAVYASTGTGTATITNSGVVTSTGNTAYDAARAAVNPPGGTLPAGYSGLIGSATTSGNIVITNEATGQVTASRDSAIRAETPQGNVTIINDGSLSGLTGIVANSGQASGHTSATTASINGDVTVTNRGTVTATSYAVSLDGTTNTLTNSGSLTTSGTVAVLTGNGNSTVINSGTIAAASASDTAISMGSGSNRLVLADTATLVGKVINASNNNTLELNGSATGALNIGGVGASGNFQGFANLTKSGTGTWTLTGSGSSLSNALNVEGGTLALQGTMSVSTLTVASSTAATLAISDGGTLTSGSATVNASSGSAQVTVAGLGSAWTNTGLATIGTTGTGSLAVSNGAQLTSNALILGDLAGATGTGTVSGTNANLNISTYMKVGNLGTGSLTLSSGATATVSGFTYIGDFNDSVTPTSSGSGSLTLSGAGTQFTANGVSMRNMGAQTSSVRITDGAIFDNKLGFYAVGANSTIYVNGTNTALKVGTLTSRPVTWATADGWFSPDAGHIELSGGALLDADGSYIGGSSTATMLVTGAGTRWTNGLPLYIGGTGNGNPGNGTVTVSGGAYVVSATSAAGVDTGAVGTLTITGAGTIYEVVPNTAAGSPGNMRVGFNGTGYVTVSDGALLRAANQINIASNAGSVGVLSIGGAYNAAAAAPGNLDGGTLGIVFGDGSGKLVLNHTSTDYVLSSNISGNGEVIALSGATYLTGTNTYTQGTTIGANAGIAVGNGGTTGSITGNVVNHGALAFNRSDNVTFSGVISGSGAVGQIGSGTLTLTGFNTYSGGTVIRGGTISIASDTALGSMMGALTLMGGTLATTGTTTTGRNVVLSENGGTLNVAASTTFTIAGTISGSAGLTKTGTGTLILTGNNTYTGLTTISQGILQLGNGGTSGSIVGDVVNNATLIFNRSDTYTFTGAISGSGNVLFQGGGTVQFSSPYQGAVTVEESTVTLQRGVTTTSVFTVDDGGTLGGSGTIGGIVANNGATISPGYSPGTLAVVGAVAFNSGSTYQVDATPSGAHDLITATGAVTISPGAGVEVRAVAGFYRPQTTYAIVTSATSVTGTFSSLTTDYALLVPSLTYDPQNVYLTLNYYGPRLKDFATTPNQFTAAVAAESLPFGNALWDSLSVLSTTSVGPSLNQITGEAYASVNTVIQQEAVFLRDAVGARLRQGLTPPGATALGYAAKAAGPATAQLGEGLTPTLWMQGYGAWGNAFGNGNAASISSSIGGFLAGLDVAVGGSSRVGLVAGYSQSQFNVDDRNSTGTIGNYDLGLYAGTQLGPWALRGGVSYTWHDVSMDRTILFPGFYGATSGGYTQGTTQVFGEAAYDFALGAYAFEPFLGLAYLNLSSGSTQEALSTAAALNVNVESQNTFYTTLGLRAATSMSFMGRTLTPSVTLGWQHAFGDITPVANMMFAGTTTPFQVQGVPIAENAAILGAGLAYSLSNLATIQVNYSGQIASEASQNAVTAQFSLKF